MTTTNDGGPVHPMVMNAALTLWRIPPAWNGKTFVECVREAQAALTECGALECLEALENARGYVAKVVSLDGEEVSEIDRIISKVYGSAP